VVLFSSLAHIRLLKSISTKFSWHGGILDDFLCAAARKTKVIKATATKQTEKIKILDVRDIRECSNEKS